MLTKPEFLKQYLLATPKERIELNETIAKANGWVEYYPTYTADMTFKGTLAEFVAAKLFHDKGHEISMNENNQFIAQYGDSDLNLKGTADFVVNGIKVEIKQTDHLVDGGGSSLLKPKVPDSLIKKAKDEGAQILFVFDFKHYILMQVNLPTGQEDVLDSYSKDSLKAVVEQIKFLASIGALSYNRFAVKMK